jgi:hypothetical protein
MWDPRSVLPPPRWRLNRLQVVVIAHAKGIGPSEPAKGSVDHGKFEEVRRQRHGLPRRRYHDGAAREVLRVGTSGDAWDVSCDNRLQVVAIAHAKGIGP